jgi:CHAT domain-containing protein/tetratricopeptide (TPR) repeat protein
MQFGIRIYLCLFFCICFLATLYAEKNALSNAQELLETEKFKLALHEFEKATPRAAQELGVLKCKFELKQYVQFNERILKLLNSIEDKNSNTYLESQLLYAKYLVNIDNYKLASTTLNKIKTTQHFYLGEKYNLHGLLFSDNNKFEQAKSSFLKSIKYLSISNERKYILKKAMVYNNLASIFFLESDFDKAATYYHEALNLYEKFAPICQAKIARTNYNLALILDNKNESSKALELLEKSLKISKSIYGEQHTLVAECYAVMGGIYLNYNQLDKALDYFNKDKDICVHIYGKNNLDVAYAYFDCGMVYNQLNDFYLAKENLEQALYIRKKYIDEYNEDIAENYLELIVTYLGLNDVEQAKILCYKVLDIEKKIQQKNSIRSAEVYYHLGLIGRKEKDFVSAKKYFKTAIDLYIEILGINNKQLHDIYLNLSEIALEEKKYSEAISLIQKSFLSDKKLVQENVYSTLQYYKILYAQNELKQKEWDSYLGSLKKIVLSLNQTENFYYGEKSLLNKSVVIADVCKFSIDVVFDLYKKTKANKYIEDAFFFIEKNKANTLNYKNNIIKNKDELYQKKLLLLNEIQAKTNTIKLLSESKNKNSSKISELEQELFELKNKYEILSKKISKKYNNDNNNKDITVEYLQSKLKKNELYISYLEHKNALYRISISKYSCALSKIKNDDNLKKTMLNFLESIHKKKFNTVLAKKLYYVLLPNQHLKQQQKIIFSADGLLHYLPFDALQDSASQFLLSKYITKYSFSASTYFNVRDNVQQDNSLLAFAPVYYQEKYEALQNEAEIKKISKKFKHKLLLIQHADNHNYFKYSKYYNLIHFATHTQLDSFVPMQAAIMLSNNNTPQMLYIKDIMQHNINASLVTLSACDGAFGKINNGEGVLNFAWAFYYAGAKNILITQWKAADKTTIEIMSNFYSKLNRKKTYEVALRNAKLAYIKKADAISAEPFYWANFILYSSENTTLFSNYKYLILVVLLGIIFSTISYFKKQT